MRRWERIFVIIRIKLNEYQRGICDYWRELRRYILISEQTLGNKKGKHKASLFCYTGPVLLAGIDLNQRLVVLRRQRFAFTGNADRRNRLGGGFLGGAQLGWIGGRQREAG